ncbi:MAG: DUF2946 family protein [Pseudomonadota bacterium]
MTRALLPAFMAVLLVCQMGVPSALAAFAPERLVASTLICTPTGDVSTSTRKAIEALARELSSFPSDEGGPDGTSNNNGQRDKSHHDGPHCPLCSVADHDIAFPVEPTLDLPELAAFLTGSKTAEFVRPHPTGPPLGSRAPPLFS